MSKRGARVREIGWACVAAAGVVLGGCAQTHVSDDVTPGIYGLTIERELDACSPARPIGTMGPVVVLVERGAIDAPVPDAEVAPLAIPRVRLTPESGFHAETNRRVPGCEGAFVHEEWTMVSAGAEGFALTHLQRWQGLASCDLASLPGAPLGDCESERRLRYDLAESCLAPCTLRLASGSSVECVCR